jgi:signal transduction histidine kinase
MSATASSPKFHAGAAHLRDEEPRLLRLVFISVGLVVVGLLAIGLLGEWDAVRNHALEICLWVVVAAAGDLMPVRLWGSVSLSMSLPVTLAAGMVLSPVEAGLVAFVAAFDPREFRGQVSIARGLYNRSQVAVSVGLASVVFHALAGDVLDWPRVVAIGLIALSVDWIMNTFLVLAPLAYMTRLPAIEIVRRISGRSPLHHLAGYVSLGLLAVLLGAVWESVGGWGLVAFLIPLGLARRVFLQEKSLEEADTRIQTKDRALLEAAGHMLDERRDERMAVAGELHDEVLPPLFKVHLMGQVLRQDLNSGRLLDLDEDIPELIAATDAAQEAIRCVVRDLRRSSLGPGGLNSTIELLANQLESSGAPNFKLRLEDVGGSSVVQLLAYQVAREAMNNAARHSQASEILVVLQRRDELIQLRVEDDGVGFRLDGVDRDSHFGLQLLRERIESAGGSLYVDTELARGTRVVAQLPPDIM